MIATYGLTLVLQTFIGVIHFVSMEIQTVKKPTDWHREPESESTQKQSHGKSRFGRHTEGYEYQGHSAFKHAKGSGYESDHRNKFNKGKNNESQPETDRIADRKRYEI